MKMAVTIPDDLFERTERFAKSTRRSRNRLVSDALRMYLARHAPHEITEAINKASAEIGEMRDAFVYCAARRILQQSEW